MSFNDLGQDVLLHIMSYLGTLCMSKLLSSSKIFWNLRKHPSIWNRSRQFQDLLFYNEYPKSVETAIINNHIIDVFFLIKKLLKTHESNLKLIDESRNLVDSQMQTIINRTFKSAWEHCIKTASRYGDKQLVEYLIKITWYDGTEEAAFGGHKDLVQYFSQKNPPRTISYWNRTMCYAAKGGHKDLVEYCIEQGATDWETGLRGASDGGHVSLMEFFVHKGAWNFPLALSWNIRYNRGPLRKEVVQFFAERGAGWNDALLAIDSRTIRKLILEYICENAWESDPEALWVILNESPVTDLLTILHQIATEGNMWRGFWDGVLCNSTHKQIAEYCIQQGATMFQQALQNSFLGGDLDFVNLMLEQSFEYDWGNVLMAAVQSGDRNLVQLALDKGAYLSEALSAAALFGNLELVKFCVEKGANNWNVGLSFAASCSDARKGLECVKYFVEMGVQEYEMKSQLRRTQNIEVFKYLKVKLQAIEKKKNAEQTRPTKRRKH